jgi:hypothetical protein
MARFVLKPVYVDAFQITEENMEELARWSGSDVREIEERDNRNVATGKMKRYILTIKDPNERKGRGFVGDWIVRKKYGFGVYSHAQFIRNFDPA